MRVQVGDVRLFFDVEGLGVRPAGRRMVERPTLLALHGGGSDSSYLKHRGLLAPLAAHLQVVYLDLRGHGRSDPGDPSTWNLATWSEDLHAFCAALEIGRPYLLAHSRACAVVAMYAAKYAAHQLGSPAKLVLAAGFSRYSLAAQLAVVERRAGPGARRLGELAGQEPDGSHAEEWEALLDRLATSAAEPESAELQARVALHDGAAEHWAAHQRIRLDLRPLLPDIRCPTLVLAGEDDPIAPLPLAEELAAGIRPDLVSLIRLPGATHSLLHDDPRAMVTIRDFLVPGAA